LTLNNACLNPLYYIYLYSMKIRVIKRGDAEYPGNLANISKPPPMLYVNGALLPQDEAAVALVGTRRPTHYGMQACKRLAYDLAIRGITIVSGMAIGVDTASHRGALEAGGRTIAVLGSGHNNIYPRSNIGLYTEITKQGAVVSEFSGNTPPDKWHFPMRNRIISGLSLGVVVIEAPRKSGALITADFALEQGREVFALPGKASSLTSEGAHRLIKEGAKLVEGADDIIEEIEVHLKKFLRKETEQKQIKIALNENEKRVFELLTDESKHIDRITEESGLPTNTALSSLVHLTIKRLAKELPGKRFVTTLRR